MLIEWGDVSGLLLDLGSPFDSTSVKKGLGSSLVLRGDGQDAAGQLHRALLSRPRAVSLVMEEICGSNLVIFFFPVWDLQLQEKILSEK